MLKPLLFSPHKQIHIIIQSNIIQCNGSTFYTLTFLCCDAAVTFSADAILHLSQHKQKRRDIFRLPANSQCCCQETANQRWTVGRGVFGQTTVNFIPAWTHTGSQQDTADTADKLQLGTRNKNTAPPFGLFGVLEAKDTYLHLSKRT